MRVIFLGTGSSTGVPMPLCKCRVCTSSNLKDKRLRSSVFIQVDGINILIDTGPDVRRQVLRENIEKIDYVLYTHPHYDHIAGLDDIKFYTRERAVEIFSNDFTLAKLKTIFPYNFNLIKSMGGKVSLHSNLIEEYKAFYLKSLKVIPLTLIHGDIISYGYRIKNFAYLTDVNKIPLESYKYLSNLDVLVIDALRAEPHISHFSFPETLLEIKKIRPKRAYLIHMSHNILYNDYDYLSENNIFLSYDGLKLEI